MNDQSEGTTLLALTDVVAQLTRRHTELLSSVRRLREDLPEIPATVGDHQPPSPRLLLPPPPPRAESLTAPGNGMVPAPPQRVDAGLPPLVTGSPVAYAPDEQPGSRLAPSAPPEPPGTAPSDPSRTAGSSDLSQRLTKRHYDYFAELDDILARLPVKSNP